MNMNEKIKELRIKKNLTQQQLADILNVSAPAVNKWEKAISYPDITLLPVLARALDTDINDLLSFKETLTSNEIANFLNEISLKDFDTAYNMVIEKINEYPNCDELVLNSMMVLLGRGEMEGVDKSDLIMPYFERLIESKDTNVRIYAIQMIVNHKLKNNELVEAKNLIDLIPEETTVKKKRLLCKLELKKEDYNKACMMCEEMIFSNASMMMNDLMLLHEIYLNQKDYEMSKYISDVIYYTSKIFQSEYAVYSSKLMDAVNRKDKVDTMKYLVKLLGSLNSFKLDTKLYKHMHIKSSDGSIKSMFIDSIKKDKSFDFIKDDKEFKNLIK